MVALGVLGTVLNVPSAGEELDHTATYSRIASWRTLAFFAAIFLAWAAVANPFGLGFLLPHSAHRTHPLPLCFLSGLMGTLTVVGAKGLSTATRHAFLHRTGNAAALFAPSCWLTHLLFVAVAAATTLQMRYFGAAALGFGHARALAL